MPVVVSGEVSPCLFPSPKSLLSCFLTLSCWGNRVNEQLGGCLSAVQGQPITWFTSFQYIFACKNCASGHGFRGQVVSVASRTTQENYVFLAQGYMKHSSKYCKPSFLWRVSHHLPVTYNVLAASKIDVWEYQSCRIISWDLMRGCGRRMHRISGRIGRLLKSSFSMPVEKSTNSGKGSTYKIFCVLI